MPSIYCSINGYFYKTFCDTGSGVNIMAAVTYRLLFRTMPLKPTYIQLQMADQTFRKVEDKYDPPIIVGRPFLSTVKAIIYIGTGEVHMYFPSEKVRCYFTDSNHIVEDSKQVRTRRRRRNRNQRMKIINDGWADYEGEAVRSEDIQREQNCPEETILAPSQVCREKIVIHEEQAPPEPPTTPSSESQDDWENRESRLEDLKTPNALPRGKLGSYPFPFNYLK